MHNNLMPSQKSDALFLKQVRFYVRIPSLWRDGRAAQGACLENRYRETYRGFESHFLRSGLTTEYWGGARVDDWGRLLSGCRSKIRPRVQSLPLRLIKRPPFGGFFIVFITFVITNGRGDLPPSQAHG